MANPHPSGTPRATNRHPLPNLKRFGRVERLLHTVIKECGFGEQIEMRVEHGRVVLAPAHHTRDGWDDAFAKMAAAKDDALLVPDTMDHHWDQEEWEW